MVCERDKGGMTIWLGSFMYTLTHLPQTLSPMCADSSLTFYSCSFDMGSSRADSSGRDGGLPWI